MFKSCKNQKSIHVPAEVKCVDDAAFFKSQKQHKKTDASRWRGRKTPWRLASCAAVDGTRELTGSYGKTTITFKKVVATIDSKEFQN